MLEGRGERRSAAVASEQDVLPVSGKGWRRLISAWSPAECQLGPDGQSEAKVWLGLGAAMVVCGLLAGPGGDVGYRLAIGVIGIALFGGLIVWTARTRLRVFWVAGGCAYLAAPPRVIVLGESTGVAITKVGSVPQPLSGDELAVVEFQTGNGSRFTQHPRAEWITPKFVQDARRVGISVHLDELD